MLRFGLCCQFSEAPVRFRQTTAKALLKLTPRERTARLAELCLENSRSLIRAIETVHHLQIGAFRVLSPLLPRYTHPEVGYRLEDLPEAEAITANLKTVGTLSRRWDIRLSFHPDQFVLLSSPDPEITRKSVAELDYQAMIGEMIGADVINIHGGGVYGDKSAALKRLRLTFVDLPDRVRQRLTLENDDISYTVTDLLPVCTELKIPLTYDVHHHRCLPDGLSVTEATEACLASWRNAARGEAYLHLSSPRDGWTSANPRPHADYINPADLPPEWLPLRATVDIEAKAKERAVFALMQSLRTAPCRDTQ